MGAATAMPSWRPTRWAMSWPPTPSPTQTSEGAVEGWHWAPHRGGLMAVAGYFCHRAIVRPAIANIALAQGPACVQQRIWLCSFRRSQARHGTWHAMQMPPGRFASTWAQMASSWLGTCMLGAWAYVIFVHV